MKLATAAVLSPAVAQIPATIAAAPGADSGWQVTDGVGFAGIAAIVLPGGVAGEINAWGPAACRRINGLWVILPGLEVTAKLDAAEQRELAALKAAGRPVVAVVSS